MANFQLAIEHLLKVEGGYVDNKNDPGGATNYGISLRFLKDHTGDPNILKFADVDHDGDVDAEDVKHLSKEDAIGIYREAFWEPGQYDRFYDLTGVKLFDMAVNMGPVQAHKIFQDALMSFMTSTTGVLIVDGNLGSLTFAKYSKVIQQYGESQLLTVVRQKQINFYRTLATRKPQLEVFLNGWINRANSV